MIASEHWTRNWRAALADADRALERSRPPARRLAQQLATARKPRLRALLAAAFDGALDAASIRAELRDEQSILERELRAIATITPAGARASASALIGVLTRAARKP